MKELIDKLSLGIIDYETPKVSINLNNAKPNNANLNGIDKSFMPDELYEGTFQIVNTGGGKLKGILYSSSRHVKIKTKVFSGDKSVIRYVIDTCCLKEGMEINGEISIVSNGGELFLPFHIKITEKHTYPYSGELKNMFHFTDYVQKDYDRALNLFVSDWFAEFIEKDGILKTRYEALCPGTDKSIALDEFLIAAGKKNAVNIEAKQKELFYENLQKDYKDQIVLQKDNWGYVRAEVKSEGAFLQLEKKKITGEDFTGNICEIPYIIKTAGLREGYNHGVIVIKSLRDEIKIPVRVYKYTKNTPVSKSGYLAWKKCLVKLYRNYLNFRMKFLTLQEWAEDSLELLAEMKKIKQEDLFLQLVRAQIMTAQRKETEAKLILEDAAKKLDEMYAKNIESQCFYLYVQAVRERKEECTRKALEQIRNYYENGYEDWKLLWLIMYLDENYDRNESLKMIRIKEQYNKGMRSPLMYCETLLVLNNTPSLLRVLNEFEKSVILFGMKNKYVSEKLEKRILDLCEMEKGFDRDIFRILAQMYKTSKTVVLLYEIVGMLIKGGQTNQKYFFWYNKAVEQGLKVTGLYEYYMYSISFDFKERIPDVILMYFVYNLTLNGERLDFLYQKVIEYKKEAPNIYQLYARTIEKYVGECILKGRINNKLATVYHEVLKKTVPTPEMAKRLPDILNTCMIFCDNPNIREVIVIHKELKKEQHVPLIGKRAYVRIYSEDAAVVFADINGNRYMQTVKYQMKKLLSQEEILKICYEIQPDNLGLLIYFNDRYFRYRKYKEKAVQVMEKLVVTRDIRDEYRQFLEEQILQYYSDNSGTEEFARYLDHMQTEELSVVLKIKVIQMSAASGLYEKSFGLMSKYGSDLILPELVLKCVNQMLLQSGEEENEDFIYFSFDAFQRGKYNENTLNYLSRYYYGSTKEMYKIWQAGKSFQCESRELEEKIIVQILFTGKYESYIGSIFESYIKKGADPKVKWAYFIKRSYDYFVKREQVEESMFQYMERELLNEEDAHYLCGLAWLKYQSEKEELKETQIRLCRKILYEMCGRRKKYEFYKKFIKYFRLPSSVENKTILEYWSNPACNVYVHYQTDDGEYRTEKMINSCHGIFTCEFLLFYGESITYYITEEKQGDETDSCLNQTESRILKQNSLDIEQNHSPYGMLNRIIICSEKQKQEDFSTLARDYYVKKKLNESIFTVM